MLQCTKGIEGKKLIFVLKSNMKRVVFRPGSSSDVSLTKEEEKEILKGFDKPGWEIKDLKEKKKEDE